MREFDTVIRYLEPLVAFKYCDPQLGWT